jgi:hypothetical protein
MAGQLDAAPEVGHEAPLAFFGHPDLVAVQSRLFGVAFRDRAVTNHIQCIKERLKDEVYAFMERFNLEVLVPENILAIPMHVPLGLAMTEVIAETTVPVIAHHHDFVWERERFALNAVNDYLQAAFPPLLYGMEHVVINSLQQKELARRLGIPSQVIPNVIDFERPPPGLDDYKRDLRREIGLADDDWLILQPTRVVQRKGIEHAIELVRLEGEPREGSQIRGRDGGRDVGALRSAGRSEEGCSTRGQGLDSGGDASAMFQEDSGIGGEPGGVLGQADGNPEQFARASKAVGRLTGGLRATDCLLEQPEILVVLHAVAEVFPPDGVDGRVEEGLVGIRRGGARWVKEAAVAIAPRAALARLVTVSGHPAHGILPGVLALGFGVGSGTVPIGGGPDEEARDAVLPGLPGPESH